jgi:hypothetical protein
MRQKSRFSLVLLLITLIVLQDFGPFLTAQTAPPTPEELDQLLAPVALYPDSLLSQITTASTNPQEILDVDTWLQQNPSLTGTALTDAAQQQGFDPAFIALVNFPDVLDMMAQHIDDYAAIGQAFSADQASVTDSIQRLRAQAYAAGALRSNSQQQVEVQQAAAQTIYVIQPANPQVVYVPVYDPTVVYIRPSGAIVATSLISFGVGIGIGALLVDNQPWGWGGWGWNWGARRVYYNHGYWGGWSNPYHPPHYSYRPRPIVWANRPGYRGNWRYRPPNYRPPSRPGNRPSRPGNRPGGQRPTPPPSKPGTPNRPAKPRPTKPTPNPTPGKPAKPGNPDRPKPNRPTPPDQTKPTRPDRPATQPAKPGNPERPKPSRPSAPDQTKPTRPDRPATQPAKPGNAKPGNTDRPKPSRPAAPGQTKPAAPNRPSGNKPAAQPKPAPEERSQPQKKPASQQKPEPKAKSPQ